MAFLVWRYIPGENGHVSVSIILWLLHLTRTSKDHVRSKFLEVLNASFLLASLRRGLQDGYDRHTCTWQFEILSLS